MSLVGNLTSVARLAGSTVLERIAARRAAAGLLEATGSLRIVGTVFSVSEQRIARVLRDRGHRVVLREATGQGRTSDLLVDGIPYDVYSPTTANVDRIVSAVAKKGAQVEGGGVVVDVTESPLSALDLGDILSRVRGVTSKINDIIVVG